MSKVNGLTMYQLYKFLSMFTLSKKNCFENEVRHVTVEDFQDSEMKVDSFDCHPTERRQEKVVHQHGSSSTVSVNLSTGLLSSEDDNEVQGQDVDAETNNYL